MGRVFLAEHVDLGTRVALKILRPDLTESPDYARRFLQEARIVAELNHPHVVHIYDFGREPDGLLYCVMEYLEGHHLLQVREREGPFRLQRTLLVLQQMCDALSAVHEKKVVHRDIKPENVFLTNRPSWPEFVKVLDFGVAKVAHTSSHPRLGTTQLGLIIGTPEYMSPEQSGGRPVDSRSDIYSLGVLLYWMLSGEVPFGGESFGEIAAKREAGRPPPLGPSTSGGEPISASLRALVMRCLERDPQARFQSVGELIDEMDRTVVGAFPVPVSSPTQQPGSAPTTLPPGEPARSSGRLRLVYALAAAAVLAGLGGGLWLTRKPMPVAAPTPAASPPPALDRPPLELPSVAPVPRPAAATSSPPSAGPSRPRPKPAPSKAARRRADHPRPAQPASVAAPRPEDAPRPSAQPEPPVDLSNPFQ
jgi:eukaryotic-like serine/threonine-protein kinase